MSKPKILQSRRWPEAAEQALNEAFDVTVDREDRPLNAEEMIAAMQSHDAVAVTVTDKLDAEIITAGAGGKCQMIANFGVGVNHIDWRRQPNITCLFPTPRCLDRCHRRYRHDLDVDVCPPCR